MNLLNISTIFVLSLLLSCTKDSKNSSYKVNHIKDVVCSTIPYSVRQIQSRVDTCLFESIFYYYDFANNSLGVSLCLEQNTNKVISLPKYLTKRAHESDFFVKSVDSIYYFDKNSKCLIFFNSFGQVIYEFELDSEYPPNPLSSNIFVFSENLYYSWFPEIEMGTRFSRKQAFKNISPICKARIDKINKTNSSSTFGVFPDEYMKGNNYINFGPDLFIGLDNQIIASFKADHYLSVYNNHELIIKKLCKSNFINDFVGISDNDFSSLVPSQIYLGTEPRYEKIIMDPYRRRYYRVIKHKMEIERTNINDAVWSVIIMDDDFDIIGEALFPCSEYLPDIIIPTKIGLYVKRSAKNEEEYNGNLILSLIEFSP